MATIAKIPLAMAIKVATPESARRVVIRSV
jgi:hypothetical protein